MSDIGIFTSMEISAAGLAAQRLKMNVISNNIANAGTTRTPEGGPYRRQQVDFEAALNGPRILVPEGGGPGLPAAGSALPGAGSVMGMERYTVLPAGVDVASVRPDPSEFQKVYEPGHPDADKDGYVQMPNVNPVVEMMDLMNASRAYEANITAMGVARDMATKSLEIGR
jgi:flagellar basal-body rod protein FlgC